MKKATKNILATLQERGYRVTKARQNVVDILACQGEPQTIKDLAAAADADEASVYRTIEMLRAEGLVEEIALIGSKPRFSLQHGHHHHIVCGDCGVVAHIPCEKVATPKLPKDFASVDSHELTFYGRCKNCN